MIRKSSNHPCHSNKIAVLCAAALACSLTGCIPLVRPGNLAPVAVVDSELSGTIGQAIWLDASASFDSDGQIVAYRWTFDDGSTQSGPSISVTFELPGSYFVTLTVTDDQGASSEATVQITVVEPVQFSLLILFDPMNAGTVALDPPGGVYDSGTRVTITAEPNEGFAFDGFQGDVVSTESTIQVVMDADVTLTALFSVINVTLSVAVEPSGAGTVMMDPPGGVYDYGTAVTITVSTSSGFVFRSLIDETGSAVSSEPVTSLVLQRDTALTALLDEANQSPTMFTLTVNRLPSDGGSVALDPPGGSYEPGTIVELTATPSAGYQFARYSGDISTTDPTTIVTMDEDKSITAEFEWSPAIGNPGNLLATGFIGKNVIEFDRFDGTNLGAVVSSGAGGLSLAGGIDVGPNGDIFVVNVGVVSNTSVIQFDGLTGEPLGTFVMGPGAVGFITLRSGPNDNLFVANNDSNTIEEYDGQTGDFVRTFVTAGSGGLSNPLGLAFGSTGDLFVVSEDTNSVLEYDGTTGEFNNTAANFTDVGSSVPVDLAFGPDGALYVSLGGDDSVARVNLDTGEATTFVSPASGGMDAPAGLAFHPDTGNLLVVSQGTDSILEYHGTTGQFLGVFGASTSKDNLFFLVFRP